MPKDTEANLGHNSQVISEEQFLAHVANLERLDAAKKAASEAYKKGRKEARAAGIVLGDLDAAMRIRDLNREDATSHVLNLGNYLEWLRAPIGHQFQMSFGNQSGEDPSDDEIIERATVDAQAEGFQAGLRGDPPSENPHDGNTPSGQAWIKGHQDGTAAGKVEIEPMSVEDTDDD